jgi:ketosteroid isomerase-like protein
MRKYFLLGFVALLSLPATVTFAYGPSARADQPATATEAQDQAAIKQAIEGQLDAFRRGDAQTAYSYAAPGIQQRFPDSDTFMKMVISGYNVLRQPTQVEFQDLHSHFGAWLQIVRLTDLDGVVFQAMYQMERQESGEWKIGGCVLKPLQNERI